jgi:hypothetical protein
MTEETKLLTLREAAAYLNVTPFRMRRLLIEDPRVTGVKVEEGHIKEKWYVPQSELDSYILQKGRKKDGRKAYLVRLAPEQVTKMEKYCKTNKIPFEPRYIPKKK